MPDTTVKYFDSTMSGAPTFTNVAGSTLGIFIACLQDGFGSVTVDTLAVAGNLATATVSGGHQFAMIGATGPVIRLSGANPAALNADHRITVTSATQFTFPTTGLANQTATGTISAKRAPAGWTRLYTGTQKAVYLPDALTHARLPLRIDDTNAAYGRVRGYETMTDVDTGTAMSPTEAQMAGGAYLLKPTSAGNKPWALFADHRMLYFIGDVWANGSWNAGLAYGAGNSYFSPDPYGVMLIASPGSSSSSHLSSFTSGSSWLARAKSQIGTAIASQRYSHGKQTSGVGYLGEEYVTGNPVNLWPVEYWDAAANARGLMPGFWNPVHNNGPAHGTLIENVPLLPGRTFRVHSVSQSAYRVAFDLTGPW